MQALGTALAGAVALLDPAAIILAGGVAASLDVLAPLILAPLKRQLPPHLRGIDLRAGQFGPRAGLIGAAVAGRARSRMEETGMSDPTGLLKPDRRRPEPLVAPGRDGAARADRARRMDVRLADPQRGPAVRHAGHFAHHGAARAAQSRGSGAAAARARARHLRALGDGDRRRARAHQLHRRDARRWRWSPARGCSRRSGSRRARRSPMRWRSRWATPSCNCGGCGSATACPSASRPRICRRRASPGSIENASEVQSLYGWLREHYGIMPVEGQGGLSRRPGGGGPMPSFIQLAAGTPAFEVERIAYRSRGAVRIRPLDHARGPLRDPLHAVRLVLILKG